jgi:hypothetical protein
LQALDDLCEDKDPDDYFIDDDFKKLDASINTVATFDAQFFLDKNNTW